LDALEFLVWTAVQSKVSKASGQGGRPDILENPL
jgi:hypothetical protein